MILGTKAQFQAAINRAQKLGGPAALLITETPLPNGGRRFGIRGERGTDYLVTVDPRGEVAACTCDAGRREMPCKHGAVAWIRLRQEEAFRVAPPARPAAPAAREGLAPVSRPSFRQDLGDDDDLVPAVEVLRAAGWAG